MGLCIISFTENGMRLSKKIAESFLEQEITVFTKCSLQKEVGIMPSIQFVEQRIGDWAKEQMKEKNSLLFIGACGIAVRAIAPCISDKLQDSPVLVMDEKGNYVIPILSGHMGGANELAIELAGKIGGVPVITTATDLNGMFAVDLFAKKNSLSIVNREGIAKVSSKVLAGKEITISIEPGHFKKEGKMPKGIRIVSYPPEQKVDVIITTKEVDCEALIRLKPKEYVIGMGCKRGKEPEKIEQFIQRSMEKIGISKNQIFAIASIERKKEEKGFLVWSQKEKIPFVTFSAEQLQEVKGMFQDSDFVKEQVGVDNVCERAALRACELENQKKEDAGSNRLVYGKCAEDGMTIAIAKREWSVVFDEE